MAFGNNTTVEYDIVIDGKPAEKSIKDVEDAQEDLDKTVTSTSNNIKMNWKAIGATAATVAVSLGAMALKAIELEKAMFGLSEQTKDWIKQASSRYAIDQQIIAGFVQTGKSARMAGKEIESMIEMAVALGRKYPHESTETFIDNLTQLNRTGEAQGYIVDILEQKYGLMDLKTISLADKMQTLEDATSGVNKEFNETKGARFDVMMQDITNATLTLGDAMATLLNNTVSAFGAMKEEAKGFINYLYDSGLLSFDLRDRNGEGDADHDLGEIGITEPAPTRANILPPKIVETASTGGTSSSTADREREIALKANERFWDDYNQTIMDATEYELNLLNERYTEYAEHITDKVALEEWFSEEQARIMEEDKYNTDLYADLKMRTFDDMADAITDFALTGEADFKGMADSIISEIIRINAQQLVSGLFGGSGGGSLLSGLFGSITANAKGNAFSNGSITAFASGGVVNSPTTFPMSGGVGLMGESGAEAIMPLTRTSTGNLGVEAKASPVNVNVNNYGNDEVSVSQNGDSVDIIITQIANGITRGTSQVGSAIESRYGVRKS